MRVIFVHIPKTAGTSITRALGLKRFVGMRQAKQFNGEEKVTFIHQIYPNLIRKKIVSEEIDKEAFKFCFCRNPYDRVVSHWKYTMRRHPDRLAPGTSFLEFTRLFGTRRDWIPQSTWVKGVDFDFIGRFENLESDIIKVSKLTDTPFERIPKMKTTKHKHYSAYLCPESIARINQYYKEDFERFNYESLPEA